MVRLIPRLLLTLGTLTLCFLVGEAAVRLSGTIIEKPVIYREDAMWQGSTVPGFVNELRPRSRGISASETMVINSRGFREREFSTTPGPETTRIIGLGDSVTFGVGVKPTETYLRQLERRLNRGDRAGQRIEVLNLGVPGHNTLDQLVQLQHRGQALSPDMVIVGFFLNDAQTEQQEAEDLGQYFGIMSLLREPPLPLRLSKLAYYAVREYFYATAKDDIVGKIKRTFAGSTATHWPKCLGALEEIQRMGRERGFKLLVAIIPILMGHPRHNDFRNYVFADTHRLIAAALKGRNIAHVDLLETFKAYNFQPLSIPMDGHPNARGHAVIAEGIHRAMESQRILEAAPPRPTGSGAKFPTYLNIKRNPADIP